jgi:hypothetical protein
MANSLGNRPGNCEFTRRILTQPQENLPKSRPLGRLEGRVPHIEEPIRNAKPVDGGRALRHCWNDPDLLHVEDRQFWAGANFVRAELFRDRAAFRQGAVSFCSVRPRPSSRPQQPLSQYRIANAGLSRALSHVHVF